MDKTADEQESKQAAETASSTVDETASETSEVAKNEPAHPQIGHLYNVKRLDNEWCRAEVLETRVNQNRTEYFVHFENCNEKSLGNHFWAIVSSLFLFEADKRLDEWIDLDRFDMAKGELSKNSKNEQENSNDVSERKLTRNQKRLQDITSNVSVLSQLLGGLPRQQPSDLTYIWLL